MKYQVVIQKKALKVLEKINEPDYSKIKSLLFSLGTNPRPHGYKKLKGREGYRVRMGDYRVIYDIIDNLLVVEVIAIGQRQDVYK